MNRLDVCKLSESLQLAPGSELGSRASVSTPGIGISDVGGEELNEALGCAWIWGEQGRQLDLLQCRRERTKCLTFLYRGMILASDNVLYQSLNDLTSICTEPYSCTVPYSPQGNYGQSRSQRR